LASASAALSRAAGLSFGALEIRAARLGGVEFLIQLVRQIRRFLGDQLPPSPASCAFKQDFVRCGASAPNLASLRLVPFPRSVRADATDSARVPPMNAAWSSFEMKSSTMSTNPLPKFARVLVATLGACAFGFVHPAGAAPLQPVEFSEAVHNLGYIDLYVAQHAKIFEKYGLAVHVTAAGGDTQAFAAVLGKTAQFAVGDPTMVEMSRERGGPGIVVGTLVQRAHYFGVSKTVAPTTDAKHFKGLTFVTSPDPNTNYSVTKKLLQDNGMKLETDAKIIEVNPGTEIGAMLAGRADIAVAYQPNVAAAVAQGAKVVFDFSSYVGPFCNTGIMVLPEYAKAHPDVVQALVNALEEAARLTYSKPDYAKEVARAEFPDVAADVVNRAIDMELQYKIPAQTIPVEQKQWNNLMGMQKYLGNIKGSLAFNDVIDNSFAAKAVKTVAAGAGAGVAMAAK
jgi:NitT/TauT family transport system substrate-binding protein